MSTDDMGAILRPQVDRTLEAMQLEASQTAAELEAEAMTSRESFQTELTEVVNPFAHLRKKEKPAETQSARILKMLKSKGKAEKKDLGQLAKDHAKQLEERNPEHKSESLLLLRGRIKKEDSAEDILNEVNKFYEDASLADEAMDFLIATTDKELSDNIRQAKELLQRKSGREIAAGKNIGILAREAAEKGLGTPKSNRDLYRDITGNPRDSNTLFQELNRKYEFKDMKKVLDFLLHSLGADMKAKGSSIPHGQLHRLLTETRSLQAILGVYRFFRLRMNLVNKLFTKAGLKVPPQLNFESMAKQFMGLVGDRYPTSDKVLDTAKRLGIDDWIEAKIIALSQLRDAIREVAANQIYRSIQHRDELYLAILEALEELEDELEELLGREEGEEDDDDTDDDEDDKE